MHHRKATLRPRKQTKNRESYLLKRAGNIAARIEIDCGSTESHRADDDDRLKTVATRPGVKRTACTKAPQPPAEESYSDEQIKTIMGIFEATEEEIVTMFSGTVPLCSKWECLQCCNLPE